MRYFIIWFLFFCSCLSYSQNQYNKWYFGNLAGLDFMTSPPTVLTGGQCNTNEGCASIANAAGALLFYTDGSTVWNSQHQVMATGLTGNGSTTQSGIIVKQPGNANIYYVFSLGVAGNGNLSYSTIDMSLAAGLGSLTVLNTPVSTNNNEKLTSVRHCNGTDFWVLCTPANSSTLNAYLVTAAGVNTVPVVSVLTGISITQIGNMKTSPNGRRIAFANHSAGAFNVCDFDISTGIASNTVSLGNNFSWAYGVEFSPDGTKLYGSQESQAIPKLLQWDLCAGSATAIAASLYSVAVPSQIMGMQLATNGKIYAARSGGTLAVIQNPNGLGAACNYTHNGISISPGNSSLNLPNFITSGFNQSNMPFTFTVSNIYGCNSALFSAPSSPTTNPGGCSAAGFTGMLWDFGDPASGAANSSTVATLTHSFSSVGTYTVKLIRSNNCGGNDTTKQTVVINQLCFNMVSQGISCASLGSATVTVMNGVGPFTYTWLPSGQTSSVATGLNPGTHTLLAYDTNGGINYTATTTFTPLAPFTGTVLNSPDQPCAIVNTGTAGIVLSGGSGNQSYYWSGAVGTQTTAIASGLGMGNYTVSVTDALTACSLTRTFVLGPPPPALGLIIAAGAASVCVGNPVIFTATGYGGNPLPPVNYTYSWTAGPVGTTYSAAPTTSGNHVFTVTITDGNNCTASNTVSANYVSPPAIQVSNVFICPGQTGTLNASGATTYTWYNGSNSTSLTASPLMNTGYSVSGSALGCTAAVTASILLNPVPVPTISSNSPVCNGQVLNLFGSGGNTYSWTGPLLFSTLGQNPQINFASPANSGVYNLTVTAINSCTAFASVNVTVHPTPTVSVAGSTVCTTQTLNLFGNSSAAVGFTWSGPANFNSYLQNPVIITPPVTATGIYNLLVESAQGCTNTASGNVLINAFPFASFSTDSPKCQGSILNFNSWASSGGAIYNWNGPNSFFSTAQNPTIPNVNPAASGNYTLSLITGACTATVSQPVIIYPTPVPVILNNSPVCEFKSAGVSVSNTFSLYSWSGPSGFTTTLPGFNFNSAIISQTGSYSVVVTDSNTCQGFAVTTVSVMPNPTLSVSGAVVCFNQPAIISAAGSAGYAWTGPGSFTSSLAQPTIVSAVNTSPETYYVMGTALNSCTAVAAVTVSTMKLPDAIATLTERACVKGKIYFTGEGGVSYFWMGPDNFKSSLQNFSTTVNNVGMNGTYTLIVTDENGCMGSATRNLRVDPTPQGALLNSNTNKCIPFCSDFKLAVVGAPIVNNSWQIGSETFSTEAFTYCFGKAGEYTISGKFTDENSCETSIAFVVSAYPVPEANFNFEPPDPIENDEVRFQSTSTGAGLQAWSWYFANNKEFLSSSSYTAYTYPDAGTYPVAMVVKNKWGCADTVLKVVTVDEDFFIFVPNSFTPNEDGLNETFHAVGRGVKSFSLLIFDRWGEKVFESNNLITGWDGTYKGKVCKSDVYAWKISTTSINGKEKNMAGSVLLYR